MNNLNSGSGGQVAAKLKANGITIVIWTVIVLVAVGAIVTSRANKAAIAARLTSSDPATRSAEVLTLAQKGELANDLANTEDPNSPATSPANVASAQVRQAAATALNEIVSAGKLDTDTALDNLFQLSKDTDATVKATAIAGLAIVGKQSDANLKMLVSRLSDSDPDVRNNGAAALGQIGGVHTAELIAPLVLNTDSSVASLTALTNIGSSAVPYLTGLLPKADADLSAQLVTALGAIGDPSAAPAAIALTQSPETPPTVHRLSIIALSDIVLKCVPVASHGSSTNPAAASRPASASEGALERQATPVLAQALGNPSEESSARARAALALGRIGGSTAVAVLARTLGDYDSRVADASVSGIQQVGPLAIPALGAASRSADLPTRIAAANALGGIVDASSLSAIRGSLTDSSPDVRAAGAAGLGNGGNSSSVPLLIPLLGDSNGRVAGVAANSLHLLGSASIPALVATLGSGNQTAAFYASQSLRALGDVVTPAVTAVLSGGSESAQVWAAVTLGQLRAGSARPELAKLSTSGSPQVRYAASQALQQLGQA